MGFSLLKRQAGRKIARAVVGAFRKRRMGRGFRKMRMIRGLTTLRQVNPDFTETYRTTPINIPAGGTFPDVWKVRISDVPQFAQYSTLYTQYRINWVKHILIPLYNSESSDNNAALTNAALGNGFTGLTRIAYSIQDSPNQAAPLTENDVLEDNGCKVKTIGRKFSVAHKPVPDVAEFSNAAGGTVYTRQKYKQWFNFITDPAQLGNNPLHGSIQVFMSQPGGNATVQYLHYVKVSFSLRDPK